MSVRLTIISNTSTQIIPIVVERIRRELASNLSDVVPHFSGTIRVNPGSQLKVEVSRIDLDQIEKLANLNLITSIHRAIEEPSRDTSGVPDPEAITWTRPTEWLEIPDISGVEGFAGLFAIYEAGNFLAITASGAYTVDWGDGTTTNHATGTTAYKTYNYFSIPDTGESSLGHRQIIVQVYPQVGNHLTSLNIGVQHNQSGLNTTIPWLDIAVNGPNLTSFPIGNATQANSRLRVLERCVIYDIALTSMSALFAYCVSLRSVTIHRAPNTTNTSTMFGNCSNISDIMFDTSNITNMSSMFEFSGIKTLPSFNTVNATNMSNMFYGCTLLQEIPLLNTVNVTNMSGMFDSCFNLKSVPNLNTSSVVDMSRMFKTCYNLKSVPMFNTSNVINISSMFENAQLLAEVPAYNTANVIDISSMFKYCYNLRNVPHFNTSNVTNISSMLEGCINIKTIPQFDTAKVINMNRMLALCYNLESVPIFNTAEVTDISGLFSDCKELKEIPYLNTSKVTKFGAMMAHCTKLKEIPLLDTSKATDMNSMFNSCTALTTIPQFDTSKVANIQYMFYFCRSLAQIPTLNMASVSTIGGAMYAFFNCNSLAKNEMYGIRSSIDYSNCKLSGAELNNIYTNLAGLGTRSISGATGNGTEVTYTTTTAHSYQVGQLITVTGLSPSGFNVSNVVVTAVPSNVQFRVTNTTTGSSTGTGTANGGSSATITVTGNYGIATHNPSIATSKGWTVVTT